MGVAVKFDKKLAINFWHK